MSKSIGIDPGQEGGVAWIDGDGPHAVKMPDTERDIWNLIAELESGDDFAFIEAVHSFPHQGVASTFKFGRNYGFLRACLIASGIPFDEVTPAKWQRAVGIMPVKGETITAKKNRHKSKAQQLFPALQVKHAIADALLIAEFCRRIIITEAESGTEAEAKTAKAKAARADADA